jgi:hypothetical protein
VTTPSIILGIDPGLKGAGCLLHLGNPVAGFNLPTTSLEKEFLSPRRWGKAIDVEKLHTLIKALPMKPETVVLEVPLALPGLSNQSLQSSFSNWGILYGSLKTLNIPITLVSPADWVLGMHDKFCADSGIENNKAKSLECYKKLWPRIPVQSLGFKESNDGFIDAALLAFFLAWRRGWLETYK